MAYTQPTFGSIPGANIQRAGNQAYAPNAQAQFGAIQSGANNSTLANQLMAGKTPVAQKPSVVAASSAVKNPNTATNAGVSASSSLPKPTAPVSTTVQPPMPTYTTNQNGQQGNAIIPTTNQVMDQKTGLPQTSTAPAPTYITPPQSALTPAPTPQTPVTAAPNTQQTYLQGLTDVTNKSADEQNKTIADIAAAKNTLAQRIGDTNMTPGDAGFHGGLIAAATQAEQSQEANLNAQLAQEQAVLQTQQAPYQAGITAATPTQVGYDMQYVNPITGQLVGGGSVGTLPQTALDIVNTYAQQVQNGQMTRADAESKLSAYGVAGTNALSQALGSGFNTVTSDANAAANTQNITTLGTVGSGITAGQTKIVADYTSALHQGENLQTQLTDLITTFGLNPNDANAANAGLQKIAQNTSDPHYQALSSYVADIANTYAQILTPPGGSVTDQSRATASGLMDGTAKGQSILAQMNVLDNAAKAKIAGIPTSTQNKTQASTTGQVIQTKYGNIDPTL